MKTRAPGADQVRVSTAALQQARQTPNFQLQRGWDVQAALEAALATSEGRTSPGAPLLRAAFAACVAGEIAPQALHSALARLASTAAEPLPVLARGILKLPVQTLKAALPVAQPSVSPLAAVTPLAGPQAQTYALGQTLVDELLARALPAEGGGGLSDFVRTALRDVPVYVLGELAQALEVTDAVSALRTLEQLPPEGQEEVLGFLAGAKARWVAMERALELATGKDPLPSLARPSLSELALRPEQAPRLEAQQTRAGAFFSTKLGLPPEDAVLRVRTRQRDAVNLLRGWLERAEQRLGATALAAILPRFDLSREVERIADLREGPTVLSDLSGQGVLRIRAEQFAERLGAEALRQAGEQLREQVARTPALAPVHEVLQRFPPDSVHGRELCARLVEQYAPEAGPSEERFAAYTLRLAGSFQSPAVQKATLEALLADFRASPEAFLPELSEYGELLSALESAQTKLQAQARAQASKLDRNVLPLSDRCIEELRKQMVAAYPHEGLGYLLTDGSSTWYAPLRNLHAGTELGRGMAEHHPEDLERLGQVLSLAGLGLLAKVHSHPDELPVFSDPDLDGMRAAVALDPALRTFIVGVTRDGHGFSTRMASFQSGADGQVVSEDRIEVR